jgi:hypothetical protein
VSAWLIALVGTIYLYIAVEQFMRGNVAMSVVFAGYAFSNTGLFILAGRP